MSLKIRMTRAGSKKRPFYRIVVADSRSPRDGRFIEKLGTYNPMLPRESKDRVILNVERIKHWIGVGAQASDRCGRFLAEAGLMAAPARTEQPLQVLPRKERKEAKAKIAEAKAKSATKGEGKAKAAAAPAA